MTEPIEPSAHASPSSPLSASAGAPQGEREAALAADLHSVLEVVEALARTVEGAEMAAHAPAQRRTAMALPASWAGLFVLANLFAGHASSGQADAVAALASPWMLLVAAVLCAGALAPLALVPPGPATRRWLLASLVHAPAAGVLALLPVWGRHSEEDGLLPVRIVSVLVVMAAVTAQALAYLALHRRMLALPRGTLGLEAARAAFLAVLVGLAGGALLALSVHALPVDSLTGPLALDVLPLTVDPRLAAFATGMVASWCFVLAVRARRPRT